MRHNRLRAVMHSIGDVLSLLAAAVLASLPLRWWPAVAQLAGRLSPARSRRRRPFLPWEAAWFAAAGQDPAAWTAGASLRVRALATRAMLRLPLPRVPVDGIAPLRRALDDGHGAVVWVIPTRMSDVLSKVALEGAGIRAVHLSRSSHGAWRSAGVGPLFNRWVRAAEDRYLASRVMIDDGNGPAAIRQLVRALRSGACVTIRLGDGTSTTVKAPFPGGSIRIPDGPVRVARAGGAPLFVLTVLPDGGGRWRARAAGPFDTGALPEETALSVARYIEGLVREQPEPFIGMLPASSPS
jgi:hypothetical protein